MNGRAAPATARYIPGMETAVLIVLALVVALVAIDAIGRLDERGRERGGDRGRDRSRQREQPADPSVVTQKIVVDLSKRG